MRPTLTRALTRALAAAAMVSSTLALSSCASTTPEEHAAANKRAALLVTEIDNLGLHLEGDNSEIDGYDTDYYGRTVRTFRELGKLLCVIEDPNADSTLVDLDNPPVLMCAPFETKTTTEPDAIVVLREVTRRIPTGPFRAISDIAADTRPDDVPAA